MVEREFEAGLERMFAQAPVYPDAEMFSDRVLAKLDRSWRWRRLGIGAAGAVGGVIAISQTLGSNLTLHMQQSLANSFRTVDAAVDGAVSQTESLVGLSTSAGMFWAVSAMMVIAAGAAALRLFEEV
ncbi:hypothetical protein [Caulobacter sp. 17J65-9]|uniref:hypothetical protein n=1 Tax=Caulobacter sp. 17J65-9 TaxID=2709382 RepID=UPI0013CC35A3|nr:hypothetical protein [Caulobacter sp. 17J65-9]NEX91282.1 hypothetical protein [Caulobacter sp. 17J65-9]